MKTIKYFVMACLFFLTPACTEFLEEDARGRLDESYFQTESGMKDFSEGLYATAHELINEQLWLFGDGGTDEVTYANGSSAEYVVKYDNSSKNKLSSHKVTQRAWLADYTLINSCNYGLANIDKVAFSSSELKHQFIGEYAFFRAWAYWIVVETWGTGAHYTEEPTKDSNAAGYQTTIDRFYRLILGDLKLAAEMLRQSPSKTGELTSGAAKALKARVLLSLAGYPDTTIAATGLYADANACYKEARTLADELIAPSNMYGYKLQNDFADVFDTNNQNNSEVIWALQMTQDAQYKYSTNVVVKQYTADPCGSLRYPSKSFNTSGKDGVYQHSAWYGRFQGDMMPTYHYVSLFDPNDKRAEGTFETAWQRLFLPDKTEGDMGKPFVDGVIGGTGTDTIIYRPLRMLTQEEADAYMARGIYADGLDLIYDMNTPGNPPYGAAKSTARKYFNTLTKYLDRNRLAPKQENGGKEIIIIRQAELYLIGAECALKLDGAAAAVPYIDALRERARRVAGTLPVVADEIDIDYILDERTREMGAEFIRWFDLKRTHKWERIQAYNPDCLEFDVSYCHVRPIPLQELQSVSNPDEFIQNEGWN